MSPHTSSVLRPTRSRPRVRPPPSARVRAPAGSSAGGSANSSLMRFATSSWKISGCATSSAGRCSTADGRDDWSALPNKRFEPMPQARYADAGRDSAYSTGFENNPSSCVCTTSVSVPFGIPARRILSLAISPGIGVTVIGEQDAGPVPASSGEEKLFGVPNAEHVHYPQPCLLQDGGLALVVSAGAKEHAGEGKVIAQPRQQRGQQAAIELV